MGILPEDIARVRSATDLVAVAGEHIALKRVGRRFQGLCPFHAEKSPSFSVNQAEGLYHCFGCGASGDVITFVREIEHLDFASAVERLAGRAGIQLHYDEEAGASAERKRRATLVDAMAKAVDWYHRRLLDAPDAAAARQYLRSDRGYDGEVVRAYSLGWAPDGWDTLARALRLPDDVARDAGLGFVNRAGRIQDQFRARVVFPIFDVRGDPVAFGGRSLPDGPAPKYKNSPETPLYRKSRVLYGLNWAKGSVVGSEQVVVCEGYTDVIGLHRAGVREAVATCGTALGEEHVQVLKNFARRLVLAYDADAAGQAAADRVYEWERRHQIDVAVVDLPQGLDPADLARRDPDALRQAVTDARPMLAFRLERVLAKADLRSPEGRARAAEAALSVVAEHPSELVRDQYLMQVADRTHFAADRLRDRLARGVAAPPPPARSRPEEGSKAVAEARVRSIVPDLPGYELEVLRVAVQHPEAIAGRLRDVLFVEGIGREAYRALSSAVTLHDAIEGAEPEVATLLRRLAVEEDTDTDPDDPMARLVEAATHRALRSLQREAHRTEDAGVSRVSGWVRVALEELREPATAPDAIDRLVVWLSDRREEEA